LSARVPITILLIFVILHFAFDWFKWASLILLDLAMGLPSSPAVFWHSFQRFHRHRLPGIVRSFRADRIVYGAIHQSTEEPRGYAVLEAAMDGAVHRLRRILMMVATLGLLPAALSHDIGSDSQRPFAIVIVGSLIPDLWISILLLPTPYVWFAGPNDKLPKVEEEES